MGLIVCLPSNMTCGENKGQVMLAPPTWENLSQLCSEALQVARQVVEAEQKGAAVCQDKLLHLTMLDGDQATKLSAS